MTQSQQNQALRAAITDLIIGTKIRKNLTFEAIAEGKTAVVTIALSIFAAPAVFSQAEIREPGVFALYHPSEDVPNRAAPSPEAALVSTARTRNAYGAIDSGSQRADFNKLSARHRIGTGASRSWCLHDYANDIVDCSYSNRSQCAATASGGLGDCSMN